MARGGLARLGARLCDAGCPASWLQADGIAPSERQHYESAPRDADGLMPRSTIGDRSRSGLVLNQARQK